MRCATARVGAPSSCKSSRPIPKYGSRSSIGGQGFRWSCRAASSSRSSGSIPTREWARGLDSPCRGGSPRCWAGGSRWRASLAGGRPSRWRSPSHPRVCEDSFSSPLDSVQRRIARLPAMKILVVEDDRKVAGFIEQGLREEGYAVDVAPDGEEATTLAHVYDYDLVVLDVMLPKKNGLQVATELRREGRKTPILMLTARDTTEDVVRGLDAGADDYRTSARTRASSSSNLKGCSRGCGRWTARVWISRPRNFICCSISSCTPRKSCVARSCWKRSGTCISTPRATWST